MNQENRSREVVIEIPQIERSVWSQIWKKMRGGETLSGREIYVGRTMADHPLWFPIFETMDVLGGDDTLPDGSNPFVHLNFHTIVGSQVFDGQPIAAQEFYRLREKRGDSPHMIIHMLIAFFQLELQRLAQKIGRGEPAEFDWASYVSRLKKASRLPKTALWQDLGFKAPPSLDDFHRAPTE